MRWLSRDLTLPNRSTLVLAICQGLYTAALSIDLTLTGLTGYQLAPIKSLATLPFALITVAGAVVTLFASLLMQRVGRRAGFLLGALTCAAGGAISVWSVMHDNFWVFCLGTACVGVFQAFAQYYRLAAADTVALEDKARAISFVLAGGVLAAILGPALAAWSKDLLSAMFAGSYVMVSALGIASALVFMFAFTDHAPDATGVGAAEEKPRPVAAVLMQPISWAAVANNVIGGVVMMLLMTAAPLAAVSCGHSIEDGAGMIQWHLVGMYAPSLFAGALIKRFGLASILMSGMVLTAMCAVMAVTSTSVTAFYVALLCLGIGWNFMFVGGTTLLARSYRPSERAKVQGVAELIRSAATALASLAAGPMLEWFGWAQLNLLSLPVIVIAVALTLYWIMDERKARGTVPALS